MDEKWMEKYQNCTPETKKKLLLWLQLNGGWHRPSNLFANMTGVYWNTEYQKRKALDELVKEGHLKVNLFEHGYFRYFAYKAKKRITHEEYRRLDVGNVD